MNLSSLVIPVLLGRRGGLGPRAAGGCLRALTHGAEEGLGMLLRIVPALVGLLTAVAMFRPAAPWTASPPAVPGAEVLGIPAETAPLLLVRPVSAAAPWPWARS